MRPSARILTVIAIAGAFAAAILLTGGSSAWGTSFNGSQPLNLNTGHELCQSPAPPVNTNNDYNACTDNTANGATPGVRTRSESDDGSVLGGTSILYTSGLIAAVEPDGTTVADITADRDLLYYGNTNQLTGTPIKSNQP